MATISTTRRKPAPVPHPKAGELLPEYGTGSTSHSYRQRLYARDLAVIEKALSILRRWMTEPGSVFDNPDAVKSYLRLHLGAEPVEHFAVLFLDSQNRAIAFERMFTGTLTQTSVYPREVAQAALRHNASAVILAHNHPSGIVKPSRADEALTNTLKQTLALVDVRVLDHVIVGSLRSLSMAEQGLI